MPRREWLVHSRGNVQQLRLVQLKGAAESGAAITLFATSAAGIPVSTTHTITGAIVGVGAARRLSAVRWGVAGRVVWAWILTIPGAFVISWLTFKVVDLLS